MKKTLLFFAILFATAFGYTAQAAESHTVACTAGNLASLASSYLTTVTNLTVTGTIDARDFKTMRDAMPLLEVIDLSGSTVAAYTGNAGTSGTAITAYPINGIPNGAFGIPFTNSGKKSLKSFIYPTLVNIIGDYAFSCTGLTGSLILPLSVTKIGDYAFRDCSGLKGSLTIPLSVNTINYHAFQGCSGFTGSLTIPPAVTKISDYAFDDCSGFTGTLTIPSSITSIGIWSFGNCRGFTGPLIIPSSVTLIDYAAFYECTGFSGSLAIPSSVTKIGGFAFYHCSGFTGTLKIPSSVTRIGDSVFNSCTGFSSIYAYSVTPIDISKSSFVFDNVNKTTCILYVPVGSKSLYKAANKWGDFTNIVEGFPTSINEISSNSISLYPNPASSSITISELSSLASYKAISLSITDISGNTLLTKSIEPSLNSATIDVSSLKSGAYVMVIQSSNGNVVKRFLKQ